MKKVFTVREAFAASFLGLIVGAAAWGPVVIRSLDDPPLRELQTQPLSDAPLTVTPRQPAAQPKVSKARPVKPVDINQAAIATLQTLPGIGQILAERIVLHRQAYGPFADPEALLEVEGIGPSRFRNLKPWVEAH